MSLPTVTATGRLGADPELRSTQAGHVVATLRVACTDRRRTPSGDWEDGDTTWLDVTAWRNLAGPAARAWGRLASANTMRVYVWTIPWVWLATAAAGLLAWQVQAGPDSRSSASLCSGAGQTACPPAPTTHVSRVLSREAAK